MITVRTMNSGDIPQLKKIWRNIFQDSQSFVDWYFSNRFFPEYSVCAEECGEVLSVCHVMPTTMGIRGIPVKCALINGVATLPERRGHGLMRTCLGFLHELLYEKDFLVISNTPVDFRIYAPFSYVPVCDGIWLDSTSVGVMPEGAVSLAISDALPKMYEIYQMVARSCSCMLLRSLKDMELRAADWFTEGGKSILVGDSYAVFHETHDKLFISEALACSRSDYKMLLSSLVALSKGRRLKACFPPNSGILGTRREKSALCALNAPALMGALCLDGGHTVKISDGFNRNNNGCFTLSGSPSRSAPALSITSGELCQLAVGYKTLSQLSAEIFNRTAADEIDLSFRSCECYNTDEY